MTYWHVEEVTITINVTRDEKWMYLDYVGDRPIDVVLKDPVFQVYPGEWHEIWPTFCRNYTLVYWEDNNNETLDFCDYIGLEDEDGIREWHVEEVTIDIVVRSMCLGECYSELNCTGDELGVMPCWQCLGLSGVAPLGKSWENLPCPMCPCDCKIRCWNECPECCDGIDNDGDRSIDCDGGPAGGARDLECQCCTDLNESIKDPCGQNTAEPCVPELATFAMFGVGLLLIVGIGMRRRE